MKALIMTGLSGLLMAGALCRGQDAPPATSALVQVEMIEVDHGMVTALMSEDRFVKDPHALRIHLQELVRTKKASVFNTMMVRAKVGEKARTESHREWLYPVRPEPASPPGGISGSFKVDPSKRLRVSSEVPPAITAFATKNVGEALELELEQQDEQILLRLGATITKHLKNLVWTRWKAPSGNEFVIKRPEFEELWLPFSTPVQDGRYAFAGILKRQEAPDKRLMVFVRCDLLETEPGDQQ